MLFGHQDNNRLANAGVNNADNGTGTTFAGNPPALDPSGTAGLPSIPENFESEAMENQNSALDQAPDTTQVVTPSDTTSPAADTAAPSADLPAVVTPTAAEPAKPFDSDLLSIKQQALSQLEPLVDHLDQTPEEKFRTTMMLIQSADNQALIKSAYEAAQSITDEKVRAQALLDVVNEINYFAQKEKSNQ